MDCNQVNGMLDLLMDGALDDTQRQAMEAHGRQCPDCAMAIRSTLQMKALFDQMEPEVDVPLQAQAKWRGAVREAAKQQRQRKPRRWLASAAAAVVALVGIGMAFTLKGAPKQSAAPYALEESAASMEAREAEPVLASNGIASNAMPDEAPGAVVEADGAVAIEDADMALAADEAYAAGSASSGQRAPACELALKVEDLKVACDRIRDLAQEYEAVADVQSAGDSGANVYVEIAAENAGDFLNAVGAMDISGKGVEAPALTGKGQVLVLLALTGA
jgi:hypothetical protein